MLVLEGQSLSDIAVQACGSAEASFAIALANDCSLTEPLAPGQMLAVPPAVKKDIAAYFKDKGIKPATAITTEQYNNTIQGEGLEYWTIGEDFIIT